MFGRKKKKKAAKIINKAFGELEFKNSMFWCGAAQITLWDKTFDIRTFPVTNSRCTEITPKQERAYEYFKENSIDIQRKIEEFLENLGETKDTNVLLSRYEPIKLIFDLNGGFGLEIFDNDEEDNNTEDECDADFVVSILPQMGIDTYDHYSSCCICDVYTDDR